MEPTRADGPCDSRLTPSSRWLQVLFLYGTETHCNTMKSYWLLDCEIDASQAYETTSSAPSAYLVTLKSGRSFLVQGDRADDDGDGDKR